MKLSSKKFIPIILAVIGIFCGLKILSCTFIKAEFKELRPFYRFSPVYFKGYKIGRAINIQPSSDYQTTIVTIAIKPLKIKLPKNTEARLKMHKTRWFHKDYIELIYPPEPELSYLKNGSVIKGKSSINIDSFFASIPYENYEQLEISASNTLQNLENSTSMLFSVLSLLQTILNDAQPQINSSFKNLARSANNTNQITAKINNSISEKEIRNLTENLSAITNNTKFFTDNLNETPTQLNKILPNLNCAITKTNAILDDVNEITCGTKLTLRKNCGGIRLFFGKPIQNNCKNY